MNLKITLQKRRLTKDLELIKINPRKRCEKRKSKDFKKNLYPFRLEKFSGIEMFKYPTN
jgi:hypothetical protein